MSELVADGEVIANDVGATTWAAPAVQAIVCTECGVERCLPGGWVAPRASGGLVLWLPAFDEMINDDLGFHEYQPPSYFAKRGLPLFSEGLAATLGDFAHGFRAFHDLAPMCLRDLRLAMQWTAPATMLGSVPERLALRRDDVMAVSSGERETRIGELERLLCTGPTEGNAVMRPLEPGDEPVEFYLDTPAHPAWAPLALVDGEPRLCLDGLVAVRDPR